MSTETIPSPPIKGMTKTICGGNSEINVGMFCAAAHAALGIEEAVAAFRSDTGVTWSPGMSGIDRMIDAATGAPSEFCAKFLDWFADNVWGTHDS